MDMWTFLHIASFCNECYISMRVGYESQGPSRAAELKMPSSRFFSKFRSGVLLYIY